VNPLSRRSFFTLGLGVVAGCSTTKSFAGSDGPTSTSSTGAAGPTDDTAPAQRLQLSSIAMVGDSITEGSSSELQAAFADMGIDDVTIDGETSRRIENGSGKNGHPLSGIRAVERLLEDGADPSAWVIALGTNDVGGFGTPQECAELIERLLTLLPPAVPLVWVNVYRYSNVRQTRVFNEVLDDVLAERGNALVADWYSIASDPEVDVLRGDNLHPNDAGYTVMAETWFGSIGPLLR